jgi:hypothetical protein
VGRIKRGGGNDGEPVRSPPGSISIDRPTRPGDMRPAVMLAGVKDEDLPTKSTQGLVPINPLIGTNEPSISLRSSNPMSVVDLKAPFAGLTETFHLAADHLRRKVP